MPRASQPRPSHYEHRRAERVYQPTEQTVGLLPDKDKAPVEFTVAAPPAPMVPVAQATTSMADEPQPRLAWQREGVTSSTDTPRTFAGVPLYTREKVHPLTMIDQLRQSEAPPPSLFDGFNGLPDGAGRFEFYQHHGHWQNRLIHGENAEVMRTLIAKDGLAGQVQMIFFDPPYGINFNSNFASSSTSNARTGIPFGDTVPLRAFRDTWRNGVHSFLDCIHERLILFRELLAESGSLFVQIGDDNVHRLALLCDEVFGAENRVATITWQSTGSASSTHLPEVTSYLLWYARDKPSMKFRQLYQQLSDNQSYFAYAKSSGRIEMPDGTSRFPTEEERSGRRSLPEGARPFRTMPLTSMGTSSPGRTCGYEFEGRVYHSGRTRHWCVSTPESQRRTTESSSSGRATGAEPTTTRPSNGMDALRDLGRLYASEKSLSWKWYADEHPGIKLSNAWAGSSRASSKRYTVQSPDRIVERCLLMSTDPGDLILDPTCGSGVTAEVAERWGRRWITIDAGRVSVNVARRHLLTRVHPWYETRDGGIDPAAGFVEETMPRVSAGTLAAGTVNDPENQIRLVDRLTEDKRRSRLTGPFTVETHNPYVYLPFDTAETDGAERDLGAAGAEDRARIVEALRNAPIRDGNGHVVFDVLDIEPYPQVKASDLVAFEAECRIPNREGRFRAGVMIAASDVTATEALIGAAAGEAARRNPKVEHLLVAASAFEDQTSRAVGKIAVHRVETSRDLQIGELQDAHNAGAFTLLGEPDLCVRTDSDGMLSVELLGYDTYDPGRGHLRRSDSADRVDCWMIDTCYDRLSFFPRLVYLPAYKRNSPEVKRLLRTLGKDLDPEAADLLCGTRSQPFPKPETGLIAVKVVTDNGAEMTCTVSADEFD